MSIRVTPSTLTLAIAVTASLLVTGLDATGKENPTAPPATFESSNTAVATVDTDGVVTGVAAGTATITARAGKQSATCSVTVTA